MENRSQNKNRTDTYCEQLWIIFVLNIDSLLDVLYKIISTCNRLYIHIQEHFQLIPLIAILFFILNALKYLTNIKTDLLH